MKTSPRPVKLLGKTSLHFTLGLPHVSLGKISYSLLVSFQLIYRMSSSCVLVCGSPTEPHCSFLSSHMSRIP